jgi:hypothetical protein
VTVTSSDSSTVMVGFAGPASFVVGLVVLLLAACVGLLVVLVVRSRLGGA